MAQGFNPYRHTVNNNEAARLARPADNSYDPLPTYPGIQRVLIEALRGRITRMDRTKDKRFARVTLPQTDDADELRAIIEDLLARIDRVDRSKNKQLAERIRLYIKVIAQQDQDPNTWVSNCFRLKLGHWDDIFQWELAAIEKKRLVSFGCLPAVLRLQRDHLYDYMAPTKSYKPESYAPDDSPRAWLQRNTERVYEELSFYRCACTYHSDLSNLTADHLKGPGELIPALLAALHKGLSSSSIRQVLKTHARPGKIPPFLA
jgi:hypothetical protein